MPFTTEKYLEDVRRVLSRNKHCFVVGEGLVDLMATTFLLPLEQQMPLVMHNLVVVEIFYSVQWGKPCYKARSAKLGISQRAAAHCSSQADNDEAYMAGEAAVRAAISGETDKMVTLIRGTKTNTPVRLDLLRLKISQTASRCSLRNG